jgi:hypothetical protein
LLNAPTGNSAVAFNWWVPNYDSIYNFGPQLLNNYREFAGGGTGTPAGDRSKYYLLSNGESDYDQAYTAMASLDSVLWLPADTAARDEISGGGDTRYLLSFGPVSLMPGESVPFAFAYVGGENLHTDSANFDNLPSDPDAYYAGLDFSNLALNATWADWVYDNPGVDTDSDGYAGEYRECMGEKIYYKGDGIPDWRANVAPPAPYVEATALAGAIRVRWNGAMSETTTDIVSRRRDFEGYNVYLATNEADNSYSLVAQTDIETYYKYVWHAGRQRYELDNFMFHVDTLRCAYSPAGCLDSGWTPLIFTKMNPYRLSGFSDSIFYFEPLGCNASRLGWETPIVKSFPDAVPPLPAWLADTSHIPPDLRDDVLTTDGFFKFYEYELVILNLLPDQPYRVSVTAFDRGSYMVDAPPMESSVEEAETLVIPLAGPAYCCVGVAGNIDNDPNHVVDIGDLTRLIDYLYISRDPLECPAEAWLDLGQDEVIDIADLAYLIGYLYLNAPPPAACR